MASNAEVELADEAVVTVDVSDNPELIEAQGVDSETEDSSAKSTVIAPPAKGEQEGAAAQAAKALEEAARKADAARKAAEARAQSERQRAEQAARLAAQKEQEASVALEQAAQSELALVSQGIAGAAAQLESLEADLARAYEAGEFKVAAQVQSKLAKAAATLDRLQEAKTALEARKPPTTEGRVEAPVSGPADVFEAYVNQYSPAAQEWLRAHPECVPPEIGGDAKANARMMKGHYAALEEGVTPNTPDYFRIIEEHTGHRTPAAQAEEGEQQPVKPRQAAPQRKPPVAAPPTREAPTANGIPRTTRSVTLTPQQQEAAKLSFPHLAPKDAFAQYARNLLELEAEGKMGRLTH